MNVYSMDYGVTNWTKKRNRYSSERPSLFCGNGSQQYRSSLSCKKGNDNGTQYPEVLKTSNAGASWTHVFNTANNQNIQTGWEGVNGDENWGFDQYAFGFTASPSDTSNAVLTGEGFTHLTSDGGKTWQAAYVPRTDLNTANTNYP